MLLGAIGAIVSAVGGLVQMQYQAAVAEANAEQARLNAEHARDVAAETAEDLGTENRGLLGEQASLQGASGISVASPSAVRSRVWLRRVGYQDQTRTMDAGERQAANFLTQANVFDAEASGARAAGAFKLASGILGAGDSLVSNAQPSGFGGGRGPGYIPTPTARPTFYRQTGLY